VIWETSAADREPRHGFLKQNRGSGAAWMTGQQCHPAYNNDGTVQPAEGARAARPYSNHLLAAGPVSRILSIPASRDATAIPLGRALLRGSSDLPEGLTHRAGTCPQPRPRTSSLFGLAPCGVCPARGITAAAVRSYRTFSPLPRRCRRGGIFSVALSVERSQLSQPEGPPGRYPAHCSAEFGLSSPPARRREKRPSGPAAYRNHYIRTHPQGLPFAASSARLRASTPPLILPRVFLPRGIQADKLSHPVLRGAQKPASGSRKPVFQ
jgi:hypothetical protein